MPIVALIAAFSFPQAAYLNMQLDPVTRAADLVSRMTLTEKASQMQNQAPAIPRLGIPAYDWWSEALHGAVGNPVTVFPQAIGLAATFNPTLVSEIGTAISDEGRARYALTIAANGRTGMHQGLTFWAPNINIFRDPRWGRGQETYGEDPFLTSRMAVAYVRAMQDEHDGKLKSVATPKHFAVHSGPDPMRHQFNAVPDPHDLWNTYLPAFQAAVMEGGAYSVMSAYNRTNGEPCSANPMLLQQTLRDRWGFRGYVVSDCGAIWDIVSGHHFAPDAASASALAVNAGTDIECGDAYKALPDAVSKGLISEKTIDKSLTRLFEARVRLGMFDTKGSGRWDAIPASTIDSPAHRALALTAARQSIVMLKNDGLLPLRGKQRIAVIGPGANDRNIPLGNYNGTPSKLATILDGIRSLRPAGTEVTYAKGSGISDEAEMSPVPTSALPGGLVGEFFTGQSLQGTPFATRPTAALDFDWGNGAPFAGAPRTNYSARWKGTLVAPSTGVFRLGTRADDGTRLRVDGKTIVDEWSVHAAQVRSGVVSLVKGKRYNIEVDFFQGTGEASVQLVWSPPGRRAFGEAVDAAKASDVVVMVLGISGQLENEEHDRDSIELPRVQQELFKAVLAVGKPTVVVLQSGSCLALNTSKVGGLLQAWYPGEEGGTAVAEVLFGRTNPSGRLPVTFYKSLDQVPPIADYRMEGRTYRYMKARPQFSFGYGLSYTQFAHSAPSVSTIRMAGKTAGMTATATVANVGKVAGDEIVQVYASRNGAKWPEARRQLVGFLRVSLQPGEKRKVSVPISMKALSTANANGDRSVLAGDYWFTVGGGQPDSSPATSGKPAIAVWRTSGFGA